MRKRRSADEVARLLKDTDWDLAKGLTIADICRKIGVAQTTYYRWRQTHDSARVDADRRPPHGCLSSSGSTPGHYHHGNTGALVKSQRRAFSRRSPTS